MLFAMSPIPLIYSDEDSIDRYINRVAEDHKKRLVRTDEAESRVVYSVESNTKFRRNSAPAENWPVLQYLEKYGNIIEDKEEKYNQSFIPKN